MFGRLLGNALKIGILAALVTLPSADADACGLKLSLKTAKAKRPIPPSKNPSRVLLVGDSPAKLRRMLKKAGHKVDSVSAPEAAKSTDYAVVMIDHPSKERAARNRFADSKVVPMSNRPRASLASVEYALQGDRPVVARAEGRLPVAAGGGEGGDRAPVASGRGEIARNDPPPAKPAVEPTPPPKEEPAPAPIEVAEKPEPKRAEPAPAPKPTPAPKPEPVAKAEPKPKPEVRPEPKQKPVTLAVRTLDVGKKAKRPSRKIVRFGFNSQSVTRAGRSSLKRIAKFLSENPNATVRLTGHTDTSGPADYNMLLGKRRAEAAQEVLAGMGVATSQIETLSEGENSPVYRPGSSSKNRCVVVEVVN